MHRAFREKTLSIFRFSSFFLIEDYCLMQGNLFPLSKVGWETNPS